MQVFAVSAKAQMSSTAVASDYRVEFPSSVRVSVLAGGGVLIDPPTLAENVKPGTPMFGAILGGFGQGALSGEAGVGYLHMAMVPQVNAMDGTLYTAEPMTAGYVAIPVWAKYNYIEKPLASFFGKAGVMPAILVSQSQPIGFGNASVVEGSAELETFDFMGVVGFGGTAPLGESAAFILDVTAFYGFVETTEGGANNKGALVSVGVSFDL
jgi:hypothetical protein